MLVDGAPLLRLGVEGYPEFVVMSVDSLWKNSIPGGALVGSCPVLGCVGGDGDVIVSIRFRTFLCDCRFLTAKEIYVFSCSKARGKAMKI